MILPEGKSKKYIKVVIGIYVLFTIVSPIITKISGKEIEVSDIIDLDEYIEEAENASQTQNKMELQNEDNILEIYVSGIKEDMKAKIEAKGYAVNNIDINVLNDGSYAIQEVILELENITSNKPEQENEEISEKTKPEENTNIKNTEELVENIEEVNKINISISTDDANKNNTDSENKAEENKSVLSIMQKQELKEYISSVYEINESNITIN